MCQNKGGKIIKKKVISTNLAPKANGYYSQGVLVGNTLYISGQLPIVPETGEKLTEASVKQQAKRVMDNIMGIVKEAGGSADSLVKINIYIDNVNNWDDVNAVYGEYFSDYYPARCVLEITNLHYGFKIEADAIAFIEN